MTIEEDTLILWDNGGNKLWLFSVPDAEQYKYIEDKPCITFGIAYENMFFKGYDLDGDTDCYIDFKMKYSGKLIISGRLGSTFSSNSLTFEFEADQTLLKPLLRSLTVN